ncbi:hypothetical protein N4G40_07295 [Pantoea eucrina]|uniref:Uncharacterized protein n=1 Tax=Pantoea eucrina TaxID=472693 RepID=A0ABU5LDZ1_9GAMM|nr:hypothetical protein [Pantoea eucrina]MDZ7278078.1 hypothetical protein [Pantoea eucrina]
MTNSRTSGCRIRAGALPITLIFCLSLFLSWSVSILAYGNNFLGPDSFIIVNKIFHSHELKWFAQKYLSQFGLQGILLAKMHNAPFNFSVIGISISASVLFSLLTAAAFSVPAHRINRIAGFPAVALYWASLAFSPWVLPFSYSLYWVPFTMIIPALITLCLGSWMHDKRKWIVLALVAIAMMVKCLCGYEYITTITLFACGGYVFSLMRTGMNVRFSSLSLIFAACVIGFMIAICVHVFQLHHINESYGLSTILNRAEAHTGTDGGGDNSSFLISHLSTRPGNEELISILSTGASQHKMLFAWTAFKEYFHLPALVFSGYVIPFGWFVLIAFIASVICLTHIFRSSKDTFTPDVKIYSLGVLFVFSGVFSWQILAWHHMTLHYHLNGQLFAYGIVPVAMVSIGAIINIAYRKLPDIFRATIAVGVSFILCLSLIFIATFHYKNAASLNDDYLSYEKSTSQVVASLDELKVTAGGSELYRGMEMDTYTLTASGWMYATGRDNARVFVFVKGGLIGEIKPTSRRDDVYAIHPEAGLTSGFDFSYNIPGKFTKEDVRLVMPDGKGKFVELK